MSGARILELVDIFTDLTPKQLELIYGICKEKVYQKSDMIVEEGSPSQEIYIILDGEVEVLVNAEKFGEEHQPGELRRIALEQKGQAFGEIALVDQGLRSASVRCVSDSCRLLEINRDDFINLLKNNLKIGFKVLYNLSADLCLKIRQAHYLMREDLLYSPRKEV